MINYDPGTVNTKLLKAGYGLCGINVNKALNTFKIATEKTYRLPGKQPKYYVDLYDINPM